MRLAQLIYLPNGSLAKYWIDGGNTIKKRIVRVQCIDQEFFIICTSGAATIRMIKWLSDSEKYSKYLDGKWSYTDRKVMFFKASLN